MLEKLKALLKKFGVEIAADKEAEFKTEVEKLERDSNGNVDFSKLDLTKFTKENSDPVMRAVIEQNQALSQQVKDLLNALGEEKTARTNSLKATEEQQKKDREKKVADKITDALKNKKITEAEKDIWKGRLEKDFDEWGKELDAKPVPKQFEKKDASTGSASSSNTGAGEEKKGSFATLRDAIKEQMDTSGTKV